MSRTASRTRRIITSAHAAGIKVYGATITLFGRNSYDVGTNEAARQTVNSWIRTGKKLDAVVDFDRAVRNPSNSRVLTRGEHR